MLSNVIISAKAMRIFRFCAWWILLTTVVIGVLLVYPSIPDSANGVWRPGIAAAISVVGLIGSATSLALLIGMLVHLFKVANRRPVAKVFWVALMVCALPVGAVLYFFVVFRPLSSVPLPIRAA